MGVESRSPPPASRRLRLAGRSLPGQQQLLAQAQKPPHSFRRISFRLYRRESRVRGCRGSCSQFCETNCSSLDFVLINSYLGVMKVLKGLRNGRMGYRIGSAFKIFYRNRAIRIANRNVMIGEQKLDLFGVIIWIKWNRE